MYYLYILYVMNITPGQPGYLEETLHNKYNTIEECWTEAEKLISPDIFSARCQLVEE